MATPMELALVELQVVVREVTRRLATMESRLGLLGEPTRPKPKQPHTHTPLEAPPKTSRTAVESQPMYDVSPPRPAAVTPLTPATTPAPPPLPTTVAAAQPPAPPLAAPTSTPSPVSDIFPTQSEVLPPIPASEFDHAASESSPPQQPLTPLTPEDPGIPVLPPQLPPTPPPPAVRVMRFAQSHKPVPSHAPAIEMTIGMQVVSWLGALAIMTAICFFLKMAIDNNIALSPFTRVAMAAGAGVALLGIGTWAFSKLLGPLAAALCGAGIAVLMITDVAAFAAFSPSVIPQSAALLGIPLIAALGVALAIRRQSQTLLMISLLGLFLAPYVLESNTDQSLLFLTYLFAISVAVLALSAIRREWEALRYIAFAGASSWLLFWCSGPFAYNNATLGTVFIGALFALFFAEMIWTYTRTRQRDPAQGFGALLATQYADLLLAVHSLLNTIVAMAAAAYLFDASVTPNLWIVALALGAIMALASMFIQAPSFRLSASIQAIALLLLANALYFNGSMITLTCTVLALGFGGYAARFNSDFARAWMFGLLALVVVRLVGFDILEPRLLTALYPAAGEALTPWSISGWTVALLALLLGWWNRPSRVVPANAPSEFNGAAWSTIGCIIIASLLVAVVNSRVLPTGAAFTFAGVLWILLITAFARIKSLGDVGAALQTICGFFLMLLSIKWFVFDGILLELLRENPAGLPFLNFFSLSAIVIGAAALLLKPGGEDALLNRRITGWWLFGLAFILLNIQLLRTINHVMTEPIPNLGTPELVKNIAVTLLWALTAAGMIAVGFTHKSASIRYVALAILAIAITKTLIIDLAGANTLLRVFSVLLTGILLFTISLLYHKWQNGKPEPVAQ